MAWEALNNIATDRTGRSSSSSTTTAAPTRRPSAASPTTSPTLRTTRGYERFLDWGRSRAAARRRAGPARVRGAARREEGHQGRRRPAGHVRGPRPEVRRPVDGHDIAALEQALGQAKEFGGPVIVHVITQKGRGYAPAENDEADQFHAIGVLDPETGEPLTVGRARSGPTSSPTRSSRSADERHGHRRHHRGDARPGRPAPVRRSGTPTASSTSASPSSTPSPARPAWPSAACTRSSPSTRPSSTAPSTRC